MEIVPLFLMVFFMLTGMPIAFSMGCAGVIGLGMVGGFTDIISILNTTAYRTAASYILTSVPMYVLMAEVLGSAGIAQDLFQSAYKWFGRIPGGVGVSTVVVDGVFGAVSGSSTAAAAAMSSVAIPQMLKLGYKPEMASGIVSVAGTVAIMIPPSIPFIVYGTVTEQSVGKLFMAGILPGLLTVILYSITVMIWSARVGGTMPSEPYTWRERFVSLAKVWPTILLIVGLITCLYTGLATVNELGAIGAVGSVIIAVSMGRLDLEKFKHSLKSTARSTCMILTIILGAMILGYYITLTQVTNTIISNITNSGMSTTMIMAAIVLLYIVLGCMMDQIAILLLTLPFTFPLAVTNLGFDPIWFGVLITALAEIGLCTPPVGLNAFVTSTVSGVALEKVFKGSAILLLVELLVILCLFVFPDLALWIPSRMEW